MTELAAWLPSASGSPPFATLFVGGYFVGRYLP